MQSKVAFVSPKNGFMGKLSAAAVLVMFFGVFRPSEMGAKIFHHWPHAVTSTVADADASPDIFHHWPQMTLSGDIGDNDSSPDIFHHWPHAA